jgi:hypothetical protein
MPRLRNGRDLNNSPEFILRQKRKIDSCRVRHAIAICI